MEEKVMKDCKVLALCSQKGGVGKTTSCVNLAVGLAKAGKKVLVIDNDPQGSMTASLGYHNPDELPITLATILTKIVEDELFENTLGILHHQEGIDLIPANIELSGMEVSLVNIMSRELVLKQYIERMREVLYALAHSSLRPEFSIEYTVADVEKCKNELLHKAIEDSIQKAQVLTTAANVKLGEIQAIDYSWGEIDFVTKPLNEMRLMECTECEMSAPGAYDIDIEADDINVIDTATVIWEIA